MGKWTCLITDWSRVGIGFVLWQKECSCADIQPSCCFNGWSMVLYGSRNCTPAESRYHPIEGELLGVVWALHKAPQYILGCNKLLVVVDHKPLLGLLTQREIGDSSTWLRSSSDGNSPSSMFQAPETKGQMHYQGSPPAHSHSLVTLSTLLINK